ncbi:hypothetical protein E2P81_ATG05564 [Venturia nashicola]|uniref:Uncharacterized protein n=1 Tax=Venturia nashicola TaxID=86259 RepID=A0A4Z1NXV9_9PEZI|nr:hypothetical protein E6O75_ATG05698 [Venturia nashicola]TLD32588.1 hypothetical protein E2P81_ATG05564 [Venturia nashicola]
MQFSKVILLTITAVASAQEYDTPNNSTPIIVTITNTRTVLRVTTVTSTPDSIGTGIPYAAANATSVQAPKMTSPSSGTASNGAVENSINVAFLALAGVASLFLL